MNTNGRGSVRSTLGRTSRRRRRRWLAVIGLAVLLLIGSGFAYLRVEWEGEDLGVNIASILNKRMRGRIEIGSVSWDVKALKKVVTGGWVAVKIKRVRVWDDCALSSELDALDERRLGDPSEDCTPDDKPDPDPASKRKPRKLLIDVPEVTAEIDVHAALFGNHDLIFRRVRIDGGELLLEETQEPYPLHAYDRTIVSILTAFYPRMKAGFRAGIYAGVPPPKFDLRDVQIKNVNLTLQFGPRSNADGSIGYALAARIMGVDVDVGGVEGNPSTYMHMNARDPLVPKFYVRLQLKGKHTRLRILDDGPRETFVIPSQKLNDTWGARRSALYEFELSEINVNRLAQMPDQWGRKDYVANNLELDISAHTIPCKVSGVAGNPQDGADIHLTGQLLEWWDRMYGGKWDLQLAVKNLGPTLRSCINSSMGGDNLNGTIKLSGPFIAKPKVTLDLEGLDFDVALSETEEPVRLTLAEVHGDIDLVNEQGSIDRTKALIRGGKEPGEVMVGATFQLKPWRVKASIDITRPIDIARFLPPKTVIAAGKFLAGKLTAEGDSELGFELKDFDLRLARTERERDTSIRVHKGRLFTDNDFEEIKIQKVAIEAGRSRATFDGWVNTVKERDNINLRVEGCFPDLGVWLERFGLPRFAESACGGAGGPAPPPPPAGVQMMMPARAGPGGGGGGGSTITITGDYRNPTVNLKTTLAGVPCMDNLGLNATFGNGIATIHSIHSSGFGGTLSGNGRIALPEGGTPRIEKLHIEGRRLNSSKLCGIGKDVVKGTLDILDLDVKPTTIVPKRSAADWLASFQIYASAKRITVAGENYSDAVVCINRNDDGRCRPTWAASRLAPTGKAQCDEAKQRGGACIVTSADRDLGGRFAATIADVPPAKTGRVSVNRKLGGTIALDDLPMAVLDPFIGKGNAGGLLSATLHLGGDRDAPSVDIGSTINLTRAWVADAYIGDTQLGVIPTTFANVNAVRIYGAAMTGQLGIDAIIGTAPPYPVDIAFSGRRIEVDHFVNLTEKLGFPETLQAWGTGTVTVKTELKPLNKRKAQPEAWLELSELEAIINHRSRDGRRMPVRFEFVPRDKTSYALSVRLTPETLDLACRNPSLPGGRGPCPAQLVTPAGVVTISGGATATQMAIHAQGNLELAKLAPLLENQLEDIAGRLELTARLGGTFTKPTYSVALDVANLVSLRLPGGDSVLQILGPRVVDGESLPGAQVSIANGNVSFASFTINVKDQRKDEQGELNVSGGFTLDGLKPAKWGVNIDGLIAGKMISAIAPGAIAQGSGLARIKADLAGTGTLPLIDAQLVFEAEETVRPQPLAVFPRGVRREISLQSGVVDITTKEVGTHRTYTVDFRDNPLVVTIDNEGKLTDVRGMLLLTDGKLDRAEVELDAENVPYRAADGSLDLILSAKNIYLSLPSASSAWQARGNIAIVNGSYKRNFVLTEAIRPAPAVVAPAKPFWDEYPSIGNADLDLTVEVRRFAVENNIAPLIEFSGPRLLFRGSPREPRLSGAISVQRGEFKLPATRARFTRTTGSIDFAENERASNPSLNIESSAPDYHDLSGQPHTITVSIFGTLEQPQWDLKTSTGFNKSQTLALLFLGRNPEQLRRSLGDQSLGSTPTNVDPSTSPGGAADQLVKELAGDWVSSVVGKSITKFVGLDVLRFEIGFGSIGLHGKKKVFENIEFIGEAEQTVRGNTLNVRGELKTPWHLAGTWKLITNDKILFQGGYLNKDFNDPAELDIEELKAQLVYKLFIPDIFE